MAKDFLDAVYICCLWSNVLFFYTLQGTFSVYEKLRQVEDFVSEALEHPLPFVLVDSASGQRLDEHSVKDSTLIGGYKTKTH